MPTALGFTMPMSIADHMPLQEIRYFLELQTVHITIQYHTVILQPQQVCANSTGIWARTREAHPGRHHYPAGRWVVRAPGADIAKAATNVGSGATRELSAG